MSACARLSPLKCIRDIKTKDAGGEWMTGQVESGWREREEGG